MKKVRVLSVLFWSSPEEYSTSVSFSAPCYDVKIFANVYKIR